MKTYFDSSNYTRAFKKMFDAVRDECFKTGNERYCITIKKAESKRSAAQNALMHALIAQVAEQCEFIFYETVHGLHRPVMKKATPEEAKRIFAGSLEGETKMAAGISGGMIFLSKSTARMSVKEVNNIIELVQMFGAQKNVIWNDRVSACYEEYEKYTK